MPPVPRMSCPTRPSGASSRVWWGVWAGRNAGCCPAGSVSVDGQTLDATSEGMVIEAGQTVRIIKIEANRLVVRAVEGEIPTSTAENPLERPIDSIAADPFGEPLV